MRIVLLLSCAVALYGAAVVLDEGWPIMWSHATATLTDFPIADGALVPEPWHFLHRMSLYRVLIAYTDDYMTSMGPGPNQSPIWGLPLQLGWMLNSGRLADPTGATTCGLQGAVGVPDTCISPNSWWGCVNYFSSVLPFLSAAQNGMFGEVVPVLMKPVDGAEAFCATYDSCKAAYNDPMTKWDNFFMGLVASKTSPLPDAEKKDELLGLYWAAALASTQASSVCNDKLNSYSGVEKAFAESWWNAGDYVAAVHFQSSLDLASKFMFPLPGRVLKADDQAPDIPDFTAEENHSLYVFSWMHTINNVLFGSLVSTWKNYMCSMERRENGREMITSLLTNSSYSTSSFLGVITTSMGSGC